MPGRSYSANSQYRYGFNGKEDDKDISEGGQDYGGRIYENRIGKWMSTDIHPKDYLTPYSFARNSPTNIVDPDGNDEFHFHYLYVYSTTVKAGPNGVLVTVPMVKRTTWVSIVANNCANTFFVHRDRAKEGGLVNPTVATQFFPDPAVGGVPKSGVTKTSWFFGLFSTKDDDNTALIKILDDFPELKGILGGPYIKDANNSNKNKDAKDRDFWNAVYADKKARASAAKEKQQVDELMTNVVVGLLAEAALVENLFAKATSLNIPGRVQSRINISNDGWTHILNRHFSSKNASQFTISEIELKILLSSRYVIKTPITRIIQSSEGLLYERVVQRISINPIGLNKMNNFQPTSIFTILTDRFGNLVTATPGLIK